MTNEKKYNEEEIIQDVAEPEKIIIGTHIQMKQRTENEMDSTFKKNLSVIFEVDRKLQLKK